MDDNETYAYAWSYRGQRAWAKKSGKRNERINFIAALNNKQLLAPFMFRGFCDSRLFDTYVEHCLVPCLSPGKQVIVDNAAFHKSGRAKQLIENAGCNLLFLPPYSPDLNPIEHYWFPIKNKARQALDDGQSLDKALYNILKQMSEPIC
jgi:transposase